MEQKHDGHVGMISGRKKIYINCFNYSHTKSRHKLCTIIDFLQYMWVMY
jgi:hypothetical protein